MNTFAVLLGLTPESYQRHGLHGENAAWPEKNCYADLWIGFLHTLGLEPLAMLPFTVAVDFEGDQWTFFKPPLPWPTCRSSCCSSTSRGGRAAIRSRASPRGWRAAFELLAANLRWLSSRGYPELAEAAERFEAIGTANKTLIFEGGARQLRPPARGRRPAAGHGRGLGAGDGGAVEPDDRRLSGAQACAATRGSPLRSSRGPAGAGTSGSKKDLSRWREKRASQLPRE